MLTYNNPCECDTSGSDRVWVSCLWCEEPHHGGRPRGQTQWCRCQCHWLLATPGVPGGEVRGICWGCMAEFCSGSYTDVYRLEKIHWLLDKATTNCRQHIDRVVGSGSTVEIHRPTYTWGDEDTGVGSSNTVSTMVTNEAEQVQVRITEWWRRVHAIRALNGMRRTPDPLDVEMVDRRWIEWSVHPPNTHAMAVIRRGFRSQSNAWGWDNPNRYIDLNRDEDLIPSPASQTPDSMTEEEDLAREANIREDMD